MSKKDIDRRLMEDNELPEIVFKIEHFDKIFDGIEYYWRRGIIRDQQIWRILRELLYEERDPFQDEEFLKVMIKNFLENEEEIGKEVRPNNRIDGYTINRKRFDELYLEVHRILNSLVNTEKMERCQSCGLRNPKITFIAESNKKNEAPNTSLIKGRLYTRYKCKDCSQYERDKEFWYERFRISKKLE